MTALLDRIIPSHALEWGRLESDEWHADAVRWQLANIPATLTRPCPAYQRLDRLMGADGKHRGDVR